MSLRVWLPLDGDLKNKGIENIEFANKNATINENGKIGKCYSFNGSNSRIYAPYSNNSLIFSIGCWVKLNTAPTGTQYLISFNDNLGSANQQFAIFVNASSIVMHAGGVTGTYSYTLTVGEWYHLMATCDGEKQYLYINGNLVYTHSSIGAVRGKNLTIGARSNNTAGAGTEALYYFNGEMNDVRIYDECLSKKQVKEISKALILHYNFESVYGMKNLLKNSKDERTDTWHSGNVFIDYNYSSELSSTTERTFTFSADVKGSVENIITDVYFRHSDGGLMNPEARIIPTTEYKRYTVKLFLNDGQDISDFRIFRFRLQSAGTVWIKNAKLTYGEGDSFWSPNSEDDEYDSSINKIEFDCSGYENNGVSQEPIVYQANSPIGEYSALFKNDAQCIYIENGIPFSKDCFSFSIWTKAYSYRRDIKFFRINNTQLTQSFNFGGMSDDNPCLQFFTFNGTKLIKCQQSSYPLNEWVHWVGTCNGTESRLYKNSQLVATGSIESYTTTITNITWIGKSSRN